MSTCLRCLLLLLLVAASFASWLREASELRVVLYAALNGAIFRHLAGLYRYPWRSV